MNDDLENLFADFPGIGPRQAKRFVYYLASQDSTYLKNLSTMIDELNSNIQVCQLTYRHFFKENSDEKLSPLARDESRDHSTLMIVERDTDLDAIERADVYNGMYFILGGTVPAMEDDPTEFIRTRELKKVISDTYKDKLDEVIIATSATPDGETTREIIEVILEPLAKKYNFSIHLLGRGISTGLELEYIDKDTMANALERRK